MVSMFFRNTQLLFILHFCNPPVRSLGVHQNGCPHSYREASISSILFLQQAVQGLSDRLDEVQAVEDHGMLTGRDQGQALGHLAIFDGLDACLLQLVCEVAQLGDLIQFTALSESSGPCVDGSDGVGGGLFTL